MISEFNSRGTWWTAASGSELVHGFGPDRLNYDSDEVIGIKRLGEVVGEPVPNDLTSMFRRVESGDGDDRNAMASLTRSADEVVTAEAGHADIRYYNIPSVLFQ